MCFGVTGPTPGAQKRLNRLQSLLPRLLSLPHRLLRGLPCSFSKDRIGGNCFRLFNGCLVRCSCCRLLRRVGNQRVVYDENPRLDFDRFQFWMWVEWVRRSKTEVLCRVVRARNGWLVDRFVLCAKIDNQAEHDHTTREQPADDVFDRFHVLQFLFLVWFPPGLFCPDSNLLPRQETECAPSTLPFKATATRPSSKRTGTRDSRASRCELLLLVSKFVAVFRTRFESSQRKDSTPEANDRFRL